MQLRTTTPALGLYNTAMLGSCQQRHGITTWGATCAQDAYNAEHYTEFGIQHVEGTTFKSLILRHYPELEGSIGDVRDSVPPDKCRLSR